MSKFMVLFLLVSLDKVKVHPEKNLFPCAESERRSISALVSGKGSGGDWSGSFPYLILYILLEGKDDGGKNFP